MARESAGIGLLDAVREALANNYDIKIQKHQVQTGEGELQEATGRFDTIFEGELSYDKDNYPLTEQNRLLYGAEDITTDTVTNGGRLVRQYRSGTSTSLGVEVTRSESISIGPVPANRATVYFQISHPLMKGSGKAATGAEEKALELSLEADRLDLVYVINSSILDTVIAYWQYVAAGLNLAVLKQSEERALTLVRETQVLIDGDARPRSDIIQLKANLSAKTGSRINGEQDLFEARQQLGLVMGLPTEDIAGLAMPANDFSIFDVTLEQDEVDTKQLIARALKSRNDIQASKKREQAANILVVAARNNLLPQLDLTFKTGYAGLDEGSDFNRYISAYGENIAGFNAYAGIQLAWPFQNNEARGELVQQLAQYRQQTTKSQELARQIASNTRVAVAALKSSAKELARAGESVKYYQETIENEKSKLKLGMSTLIDMVNFEDRLTNALSNTISKQLQYAESVARLRFETGTLVSVDIEEAENSSIGMEALTSVPVIGP